MLAQSSPQVSDAILQASQVILLQRFHSFGIVGADVSIITFKGKRALSIQLPTTGTEPAAISILLGPGQFDFWGTGASALPPGAVFHPEQYTSYNPKGKPLFTGQDLDPNTLSIGRDAANRIQLDMGMRGAAIQRFLQFTSDNLNNYMTITLDSKVLMSAVIQAPINGIMGITGDFTQQVARAIMAVIRSGPLPDGTTFAS